MHDLTAQSYPRDSDSAAPVRDTVSRPGGSPKLRVQLAYAANSLLEFSTLSFRLA